PLSIVFRSRSSGSSSLSELNFSVLSVSLCLIIRVLISANSDCFLPGYWLGFALEFLAALVSRYGSFQGRKDLPVNHTLRQLAELVQGTVQGNADLVITAARTLAEAQPGDITFV